jgi:ribonuclease I
MNNKFLIAFVLSIALYVVNVNAEKSFDRNTVQVKDVEIDYLVFRQIWPPTSCMFPGAHTCSFPKNVTTWVVHGLWPSQNHKMGPLYCNKTLPFDFNRIKWLLPQLLEFWPNLYTDSPLDSFWCDFIF